MEQNVKWFGTNGVGMLIQTQRPDVTPTVRTMAAAYSQRTHVADLLKLIDAHKVKLTEEEKERVEKIRALHMKFMIEGGE